MGYTTEHRGRIPKVVVPGTGQGLLLNKRKTKIMVVDKNRTDDHKFIINGEELEEMKSFFYLGSLINTEVSCMPDVN